MADENKNTSDDGRERDRRSDLAVMDVQEYKQKRRLERIFDIRDAYHDTRNEAWESYTQGLLNHQAYNITIQRAMKNAISEARNLLTDEDETATAYWTGEDRDPIGVIPREHGDDIVIQGLREYHQTQEIYTDTITETTSSRHLGETTTTREVTYTIPDQISDDAFDELWEYLGKECGLDVELEQTTNDDAGFDYSDILENGPPGDGGPPEIHADGGEP